MAETPGADPIRVLSSFLIEPLFLFQQAVVSAKNIDQAPLLPFFLGWYIDLANGY